VHQHGVSRGWRFRPGRSALGGAATSVAGLGSDNHRTRWPDGQVGGAVGGAPVERVSGAVPGQRLGRRM